MTYNLSFMDNVTGVNDIAIGLNDLSGGWLFGMILFSIWIIIIISVTSRGRPIGEVLLSSSLIVGLMAGTLLGLGAINPWILSLPVVGILAGVVIMIWGK